MRPLRELRPATWLRSLLAGLTTWVTLLAWTKFAGTRPGSWCRSSAPACWSPGRAWCCASPGCPAVLVALAQVLVVLVWLHHREVGDLAVAGWVPTSTRCAA